MANSYPFVGKIPISGAMAFDVSAFAETGWDTMTATLPAQNSSAA